MVIWTLLLVGLAAMEFPGVFFFKDRATPEIFGLPFIYGYNLLWWAYMCAVMLYAYLVHWGRPATAEGGAR
ncbi:MAG: hypothetical protein DCC50_09120 [Acidobacteria bacterium]|nr:MAG: hypothetical protein DCC50_09120 [Acidobacteriota bacterium]